jgi:hypothetical protein
MTTGIRARSRRTRLLAAITAAGAITLIASAAWAVIPDAEETIHGCIAPDGVLRVVDTDLGQECKRNERPLDWSAAPAPPPAGELPDAVVQFQPEEMGLPRGTEQLVGNLTLAPGNYLVTGKVQISSSEPTESLAVGCKLVPSNEDGTPGDEDGPGADQAGLLLNRVGEPGSTGALALFASQRLSQRGVVQLLCTANAVPGSGTGPGGFASYRLVRAVEVGSISDDPGPLP